MADDRLFFAVRRKPPEGTRHGVRKGVTRVFGEECDTYLASTFDLDAEYERAEPISDDEVMTEAEQQECITTEMLEMVGEKPDDASGGESQQDVYESMLGMIGEKPGK